MPGTHLRRDELDQLTVATDEVVRGNPEMVDLAVEGMGIGIKRVGEETLNGVNAEAVGGEADGVDDD